MNQIEQAPALIDVQLAFTHWRNTRSQRSATPARLRALAVGLLDTHSAASVCEALRVNSTALKQWSEQPLDDAQGSSDFIPVALPDDHSAHFLTQQLTIHLPNGVQVCTQGSYTLVQVLSAVGAPSASA